MFETNNHQAKKTLKEFSSPKCHRSFGMERLVMFLSCVAKLISPGGEGAGVQVFPEVGLPALHLNWLAIYLLR